jgi:hypothetical protein
MLAALFALLLVYTAITMGRGALHRPSQAEPPEASGLAATPDGAIGPAYRTRRLPAAVGGSFVAGNVSGLLGVGGGIVTVPLLHLVMVAPMRVAVATSNFMIGMTAAAGAYAYLFRGDVDATVAAPVVLGVAAGAALGARLSARLRQGWLIGLFVIVVLYVAFQMAMRAVGSA